MVVAFTVSLAFLLYYRFYECNFVSSSTSRGSVTKEKIVASNMLLGDLEYKTLYVCGICSK